MKALITIYRALCRLLGIVKRDKNLLFTRENIRIDPDIDYGEDEIVAYVEVWFDSEAKFGIKLGDEEFINVFAVLSPFTEELRVEYIIYRYNGRPDEHHIFKWLTKDEQELLREMIEEVNLRETGMTVDATWFSFENEDCFASAGE